MSERDSEVKRMNHPPKACTGQLKSLPYRWAGLAILEPAKSWAQKPGKGVAVSQLEMGQQKI